MSDTIEKVSIIISKGSLEGIYPGLIMANGATGRGNRSRTCSSPSSGSTPSTRHAMSTSSWRRSATLACTWPRWRAGFRACRQP